MPVGPPGAEERQVLLRELLKNRGEVRLAAAATEFGVHPMTVRRDFAVLQERGLARRVRGGIVAVDGDPFAQRMVVRAAAKRRIADKLLPLVPPGATVGLDSSTTVHALATVLPAAQGISVVTTCPETFSVLRGRPGVRSYLTGGEHEDDADGLVGPLALSALEAFNLDVCFLSAKAVDDSSGGSEVTVQDAAVKLAMARASARVVLAVDSSKLGGRARARSVPWDAVDVLVTELDPSSRRLEGYRRSAVEVR